MDVRGYSGSGCQHFLHHHHDGVVRASQSMDSEARAHDWLLVHLLLLHEPLGGDCCGADLPTSTHSKWFVGLRPYCFNLLHHYDFGIGLWLIVQSFLDGHGHEAQAKGNG